jgi:hypothetical protein
MPVMHKYRNRNDYYIVTNINQNIVTFQLTPEGGEDYKMPVYCQDRHLPVLFYWTYIALEMLLPVDWIQVK